MSLINDLLTDLDQRRGDHREQQTVFADLTPVTDDFGRDYRDGRGFSLVLAVFVVLAVAGGGYFWLHGSTGTEHAGVQTHDITSVVDSMPPVSPVTAVADNDIDMSLADTVETEEQTVTAMMTEHRMPLQMDTSLSMSAAMPEPDPEPQAVPATDIVATAQPASPAVETVQPALQRIRVDEEDSLVRLKLSLSGKPEYRTYQLTDPHRMVVEFEQAVYEVAGDPVTGNRYIKGVRNGNSDSMLKVVFDLNGPMKLADTRYVSDAGSSQLLLSLQPMAVAPPDVKPEVVAVAARDEAEPPAVMHNRQIYKRPRTAAADASGQDDYQRGLRHYNRSEFRQSVAALASAVEKAPQLAGAHYLLASALLQLNERAAAEAQLVQALQIIPDSAELRRLYAHLLLDRGDLRGALAVLRQSMPAVNDEPEYHALIAAVAQELDDHAQAVQVYRQLVEVVPANGVWWMGMGISLEALAQPEDALVAYRQALDGRALATDLRQFVAGRIQSLTRELSS